MLLYLLCKIRLIQKAEDKGKLMSNGVRVYVV